MISIDRPARKWFSKEASPSVNRANQTLIWEQPVSFDAEGLLEFCFDLSGTQSLRPEIFDDELVLLEVHSTEWSFFVEVQNSS
jgi:hypothetical protein